MTAVLAGVAVFAAVWIGSLPSPANFRLEALLRKTSEDRSARRARIVAESRERASRAVSRTLNRGRREAAARQAAVIELCDGIAAELIAGRPADIALANAGAVLPGLAMVTEAARTSDDVPTALEHAARTPGFDGLRLLAGCWRVGVDRGGMLATVIEGLADALRDERSHREEVALQLAGPRATARLLAVLPLLGLAMAAALGAHPLRFLFATAPGLLCLGLGTGLDALGLWWTSRLATGAEETR
jgi:tight adherence protein B